MSFSEDLDSPVKGKKLSEKHFRQLYRIRLIEEIIADRYSDQRMRCPVHLSIGQEASAVAVCAELQRSDQVFSGHRSHAHYLAKGGSLTRMILELHGKPGGCTDGIGGSMHLVDISAGFMGATPIVGSSVPIAVGASLSLRSHPDNNIVVAFFGDGAMETGVVYESLNFAQLKKLPMLFVCEDNLYSVYSAHSVRKSSSHKYSEVAEALGLKTFVARSAGNVVEVFDNAKRAVQWVKKNSVPAFLELPVYRFREHCGPNYDDHLGYRSAAELKFWRGKDFLVTQEQFYSRSYLSEIKAAVEEEVSCAFSVARDTLPRTEMDLRSKVYL
ncbi:thiamine pyrophosphate-dependent dehydrogenase E1 component subunit alpha [Litorivicinus sp.]|nr:thiamine pyrophosphate-dependent dehydrogenase E1 component subunit alpha [Litorivicinus sp.]